MARKTGQIIRRGSQLWMVHIYAGRDPETRKRTYIGKSILGGLRIAQVHLTHMLAERDLGRNIRSSKQTLGEYLDHWLDICARPRLRASSIMSVGVQVADILAGFCMRYVKNFSTEREQIHPVAHQTYDLLRRFTNPANGVGVNLVVSSNWARALSLFSI